MGPDRKTTPLAIPLDVLRKHADWEAEVAQSWYPGVSTWRLTRGTEVRYLKLSTLTGPRPTLEGEAARMRWALAHLPVPEVLGYGLDPADGMEWLLTRELPGLDATVVKQEMDHTALVGAIGCGLRRFHESAPVDSCPFDFCLDAALTLVDRRLWEGCIDAEEHLHAEFAHLGAAEAVALLHATRPPTEDLVVCHGDYCFPNILLAGGDVTGFVDLGELGVADRWWDVAVGAWSVAWNVGSRYEDVLYEAYGIEPDTQRIAFYRLLYDLVS